MVSDDSVLVHPFPMPGKALTLAYRELELAYNGGEVEQANFNNPGSLPRPWDPGTVQRPDTRRELWLWLDQVVTWLNHEYVFDPADAIPACWVKHRHLVHEIAVLADQRRKAQYSPVSDAMEEWHRYGLPQFFERMRRRVGDHCAEGHAKTWPATGRFSRHVSPAAVAARKEATDQDLVIARSNWTDDDTYPTDYNHDFDPETGEIIGNQN